MAYRALPFLFFVAAMATAVHCNLEVDVLYAWKTHLVDPNNVLQSWDPTLVNPCTWYHITCNSDNSVTRVDLGNAGLSGVLVPQLGLLSNLEYFLVYNNEISGSIPTEIGNLTKLVSLHLHHNLLSGSIPASLGNLASLRFMNLNSNKLTGGIPSEVLNLIPLGNLRILNVSENVLTGTVGRTNKTGLAVTTIIQDPKAPN